MILADWIFLGALAITALIGAFLGFGKVLKIFTSGIFGIIISVVICYLFGGIILSWPFVQDLLAKLASFWEDVEFLNAIHLEIIISYIVLFLLVTIVRIIIVKILKGVFEIKFIVFKILNKFFGMVAFAGLMLLLMLFAFQIIGWIGGSTAATVENAFSGGKILIWLYENNPLMSLPNYVK